MSGSGASNLDDGSVYPNSNVNGEFANKTGANYAGNFGSNQIPSSSHSMPEPRSNVEAVSGTWTGGRRKNIGRLYRMKPGRSRKAHHTHKARSVRRRTKSIRRKRTKTRSKKGGRRHKKTAHRRSKRRGKSASKRRSRKYHMRGGLGYMQYQSNVPFTPGYAVADENIDPKMSALANPPPYKAYDDCQDNYNHYAATQ